VRHVKNIVFVLAVMLLGAVLIWSLNRESDPEYQCDILGGKIVAELGGNCRLKDGSLRWVGN
jgi:hypothetical protein